MLEHFETAMHEKLSGKISLFDMVAGLTRKHSVFDVINAVYHDKPLNFIGTTFREKLVFHHRAVNEADSCLLTRRVGSKPCILIKISHINLATV